MKEKNIFDNIDYRENCEWTVYIHISPSNKYYVGITKLKPHERWGLHGQMYKKQFFYNAIEKYGWENFEHEIIAEHLTKDEACKMEIALIKALDSYGEHGYNCDPGGTYQYKERNNLCGMKIGNVFVEKLLGINKYGLYDYDCRCDCNNHVILNQQQLLYTKKYICCNECKKKLQSKENADNYSSKNIIRIVDEYLEVLVGGHTVLFDKEYYSLLSKSTLYIENDNRVKIYSPIYNIINKSVSTILCRTEEKLPIFKNFNCFDFRISNVIFVSSRIFTIYHHLYNNRYSKTYRIETKVNKNGEILYKPSFALYKGTGKRIKSTTSLNDAICLRNNLIQEKYGDIEELRNVISLFYCNERGSIQNDKIIRH